MPVVTTQSLETLEVSLALIPISNRSGCYIQFVQLVYFHFERLLVCPDSSSFLLADYFSCLEEGEAEC